MVGQLVEYFDSKKDPMKEYFMEKMQFTLSRPQTLKILVKEKRAKSNLSAQKDFFIKENVAI
jgi:hypothetical protein